MTTAHRMIWVAEGTERRTLEKRDGWLVWLVAFELVLFGGGVPLFWLRF